MRLSAPRGCESAAAEAAAAAEEESVGRLRAGGARRMKPLPGAPGVAVAAALLLLLLPRARADEHEHTVRRPGRCGRPGLAPQFPPRQAPRSLEGPAVR